jgi:hypothetical protein
MLQQMNAGAAPVDSQQYLIITARDPGPVYRLYEYPSMQLIETDNGNQQLFDFNLVWTHMFTFSPLNDYLIHSIGTTIRVVKFPEYETVFQDTGKINRTLSFNNNRFSYAYSGGVKVFDLNTLTVTDSFETDTEPNTCNFFEFSNRIAVVDGFDDTNFSILNVDTGVFDKPHINDSLSLGDHVLPLQTEIHVSISWNTGVRHRLFNLDDNSETTPVNLGNNIQIFKKSPLGDMMLYGATNTNNNFLTIPPTAVVSGGYPNAYGDIGREGQSIAPSNTINTIRDKDFNIIYQWDIRDEGFGNPRDTVTGIFSK